MLRALLIAGTIFAAGCPSTARGPEMPMVADDTALRIRVARDEATRAAGVDDLSYLVKTGDVHAQELALRGLGRIGGEKAMTMLLAVVERERDRRVTAAAYAAIGVAASLDDLAPLASKFPVLKAAGRRLWEAGFDHSQLVAVIEALGRAGGELEQPVLLLQGEREPEAVALALGRMGRRKLRLGDDARRFLVALTTHAQRDVRYAATYALSREHKPARDTAVDAALIARISDDDAEVRATAIAGIAKRGIELRVPALEASLRDRDWRVAVEAVRALAGEHGDEAGRALVAEDLSVRYRELVGGATTEVQVITEALRTLLAHPPVRPVALERFAGGVAVAALASQWIQDLGAFGRGPLQPTMFTQGALPEHLRVIALAEVFARGDDTFQRSLMRFMLEHRDHRVRAAGLGMLVRATPQAIDHEAVVAAITAALGSDDVMIAGAAAEAIGPLYDAVGTNMLFRAQLDTALVARAMREQDAELAAGLYDLIGTRGVASGADACRAGLTGHPVRARAASACLKALGQVVPPPQIAAATPPPVDFEAVINKHITWHVLTTAGEIVIELRPDLAPWNVATIVALTRRGFYDGLEFHRVVPNFVVQGGDPTMSGVSGVAGLGFTTPAEPTSSLDGPGFAEGGIGIADAGRDSGGSQWFAMHSRAPHLDGRYTYIGRIISGQTSADSLLIGDKVVKATVELR
jgi:cyclophilin family peptidyl-prolyl cis-trans isomerase/HEAT repeat protein